MNKVRTRMQVPKCLHSSLEDAPYKISMIENELGNLKETHRFHSKAFSFILSQEDLYELLRYMESKTEKLLLPLR